MEKQLKYNEPWILQRADPYVYCHTDGTYYFTASVPEYDRIVLRRAAHLADLADAEEHEVWHKHESGPPYHGCAQKSRHSAVTMMHQRCAVVFYFRMPFPTGQRPPDRSHTALSGQGRCNCKGPCHRSHPMPPCHSAPSAGHGNNPGRA